MDLGSGDGAIVRRAVRCGFGRATGYEISKTPLSQKRRAIYNMIMICTSLTRALTPKPYCATADPVLYSISSLLSSTSSRESFCLCSLWEAPLADADVVVVYGASLGK